MIQNEIEDERIDEKFSKVFEGNMRFFVLCIKGR